MPLLLKSIEQIIATQFKRQGYWIVFNKSYNNVHAFNEEVDDYLSKEETDETARAEFIAYMKDHFPEVKIYPVFDSVSLGYMIWPYLGSLAIDMDKGDAVYQALSDKYNDPEKDANTNNAVLWTMRYEDAVNSYEKRKALSDAEFGDD